VVTTRPDVVRCQGDGCDTAIQQQRMGAPRKFCDTCRATRNRASNRSWKQANPDRVTQQQRDRRQRRRRRYDTTRRTA
jgi:hypothetical protein